MTNEEREALIAQGWTPPVVDPDLALATELSDEWLCNDEPTPEQMILRAIKRGRALAAAEAKPGLVWKKHYGGKRPIADRDTQVGVIYDDGTLVAGDACERDWSTVTLYAEITPPEVVDPDIAEAWDLVALNSCLDNHALVLSAIKRGRAALQPKERN